MPSPAPFRGHYRDLSQLLTCSYKGIKFARGENKLPRNAAMALSPGLGLMSWPLFVTRVCGISSPCVRLSFLHCSSRDQTNCAKHPRCYSVNLFPTKCCFVCVLHHLRGTPPCNLQLANRTAFWHAYTLGSTRRYININECASFSCNLNKIFNWKIVSIEKRFKTVLFLKNNKIQWS